MGCGASHAVAPMSDPDAKTVKEGLETTKDDVPASNAVQTAEASCDAVVAFGAASPTKGANAGEDDPDAEHSRPSTRQQEPNAQGESVDSAAIKPHKEKKEKKEKKERRHKSERRRKTDESTPVKSADGTTIEASNADLAPLPPGATLEVVQERVPCDICKRKFNVNRIEKHTVVCLKRKEKEAQKRETFDSKSQRLTPLKPIRSPVVSGSARKLAALEHASLAPTRSLSELLKPIAKDPLLAAASASPAKDTTPHKGGVLVAIDA